MIQKKQLIAHSLPLLMEHLYEHFGRDWELDPDDPANMIGFSYTVGLMRDITEDDAAAEEAEANKPTRAEILAKARAAKAEKRGNQ